MDVGDQVRQAAYVVVGAGDWVWDVVRGGADRSMRAWRNRGQWAEDLEHVYDEFVSRGEGVLDRAGRDARGQARRARAAARRVPGGAAVEGEVTGWASGPEDLPISDYDDLTAAQITAQLAGLSERGLHQVEGYETRHQHRATVLRRIEELRSSQPWPGYDEMTVDEIVPRLRELPADERAAVVAYEQRHKLRRTILDAAETTPE